MGTPIYKKMYSIRDFRNDMDRVGELTKRTTPDAAEAIRSLAHQLGRTGLNIEQMKYPNKSL